MKPHRLLAVLLGATVLLAFVVALREVPADGQDVSDRPSTGGSTRFRATLVRVTLPDDGDAKPLTLSEIGVTADSAVTPRAALMKQTGEFGSLRYPHSLLAAMRKRGKTKVLFGGEVEVVHLQKARLQYGQKFPIRSVDIRGNQTIVTTKLQEVGMEVELAPTDRPDFYLAQIEFSAVSVRQGSADAIITSVGTSGGVHLRDGYTAVFTFVDRIAGVAYITQGDSQEDVAVEERDTLVQFFVLLTRTDLDTGR